MRSALIALILVASPTLAVAQNVPPNFDARPGCQAGASSGILARPDVDACVRSEMQARDQMTSQWNQFTAADKQRCIAKTNMGGPPSYVEVLTA